MKKILLLIIISLISIYTVSAQDTIFLKNGQKVIGKISKEDSLSVFLRTRISNEDVNTFVVKSDIALIRYHSEKISVEGPVRDDKASIGIGFGQKYGGYGANILFYPQRNIGLFAAGGFALAGFGYNVGVKLRFMKEKTVQRTHFYMVGMYGYNAAIVVANGTQYNKLFYGPTFGAGVDIRPAASSKGYLTLALLIPIRGTEVQDYMDYLKNFHNVEFKTGLLPVSFSLGYRFILN